MEKPRLRQRITLNISITIGCFVFILVLCSILSIVSYNISSATLYNRYRAQMKSIVDVAESYIDDDDMSECAETYQESPKYQETQAYFDQFVTYYTDLHYLYILKVTDESDFGYDPIFKENTLNKTYAAMNEEEKNQVSHRGLALKKLLTYLQNNGYAR